LSQQLLEPLLGEGPVPFEAQCAQVRGCYFAGVFQYESGARAEALASFQRGRRAGEQGLRESRDSVELKDALARCCFWVSKLEGEKDHAPQALESSGRAAVLFEELAQAKPGNPYYRGALAISYHVIGRTHLREGRPEQALSPLRP